MSSVAVSQTKRTRVCTVCAKEGIKYLGEHLRNKHHMTIAQRAPHLKRSLMLQKAKDVDDNNATVVSNNNNAVKCTATVCEESNDDARRDVTVEFREQEQVLGANFQQI